MRRARTGRAAGMMLAVVVAVLSLHLTVAQMAHSAGAAPTVSHSGPHGAHSHAQPLTQPQQQHAEHADHAAHGDHGAHGADGSHASHGDGGHAMAMYFTWRLRGPILFPSLVVDSTASYLGFLLLLAIGCFAREALAVYRVALESDILESARWSAAAATDPGLVGAMEPRRRAFGLLSPSALSSLLHGINMLLGYLIMLAVMSYDAWMLLVVVLASAVGHYALHRSASLRRCVGAGAAASSAGRGHERERGDEEERRGLTPGGKSALFDSQKAAAMQLQLTKDCCD